MGDFQSDLRWRRAIWAAVWGAALCVPTGCTAPNDKFCADPTAEVCDDEIDND